MSILFRFFKISQIGSLTLANWLCFQDRQGDISEDETIKYKSYLLSLGIDDPVTRNAFSSGDAYRKELAKQMVDMLLKPITVNTSFILTDP